MSRVIGKHSRKNILHAEHNLEQETFGRTWKEFEVSTLSRSWHKICKDNEYDHAVFEGNENS